MAVFNQRKSSLFLRFVFASLVVLILLLIVHPVLVSSRHEQRLALETRLVRELDLPDLCLFTEARYTRHISLSDLHTPFQDFPMSFDLFPSGSHVAPPMKTKTSLK